MKSFWKKHWKWLVPTLAAVAALIAGVVFLYCKGFRITYAPELENEWEAVSACAAWAGVIVAALSAALSCAAVLVAINVPKKVAERQDKIALFEKRYEIFNKIDCVIHKIIDDPFHFNPSILFQISVSEIEIKSLFDEKILSSFKLLVEKIYKISLLLGAYDSAQEKGYSYFENVKKSEQEIEEEVRQCTNEIKSDFIQFSNEIYKNFLKL